MGHCEKENDHDEALRAESLVIEFQQFPFSMYWGRDARKQTETEHDPGGRQAAVSASVSASATTATAAVNPLGRRRLQSRFLQKHGKTADRGKRQQPIGCDRRQYMDLLSNCRETGSLPGAPHIPPQPRRSRAEQVGRAEGRSPPAIARHRH